jgi:CBS domain-containing protein
MAVKTRTVGEVMTSEVVHGYGSTSLGEVARLLDAHRISGMPVVDADDKVIGVISHSDLTRHHAARSRFGPTPVVRRLRVPHDPTRATVTRARGWTAGDLMTSPAITTHPEQDVVRAARLMERRHISRLPVVDEEDRLIGIATRRDLLRIFLRTDEDIREEVEQQVRVQAPPAPEIPLVVSVVDGLVTLTGRVRCGNDIASAVWSAWRVDGVVGVVNQLTGADVSAAGGEPPFGPRG